MFRENICDKCNKTILEYKNYNYYKQIPFYLSENYMIFCKCNGKGLTKYEAKRIDFLTHNDYINKMNYNYNMKH